NFYRAGKVNVVGGANPLLAFTTIDPSSGQSTVMISTHGRTQWNTPVQVASAGGIISLAVVPNPAGGWIAAWSEFDSADLANPYPSTRLKYSVSTSDGSFWTDPVTIDAQNAALFDLKMVGAGKQVVLTWLSTTEGPKHQTETLFASVLDGTQWSQPAALLDPQNISTTSLAGQTNGAALLAVTTGD